MKKLMSLKALTAVGLPILPYKRLSESNFKNEILDFLSTYSLSTFMIRTDSDSHYSPSINNAINTLDIHSQILKFFKDGYAVLIMHPGNTDKNFHSINILYEENLICIEIVGPGFIATDLNRNNILHERLELDPNLMKVISREAIVSNELYIKQLEGKLSEGKHTESYLNKYKSYVLLDEAELLFVKNSINKLVTASKIIDETSINWVASLSFLDYRNKGNEPIFWDLYTIK